MSQILTISDTLYSRLEQIVRERGFADIEQLLETWQTFDAERQRRHQIVQRIDKVRERMFTTYGEMRDSVEGLRQDRARG